MEYITEETIKKIRESINNKSYFVMKFLKKKS